MSPSRLALSLFLLFSNFLLVPASEAQITNVTNDTATPVEGAGHNYIKLLSETVNPASGSLSLRIQLPVPRPAALPFLSRSPTIPTASIIWCQATIRTMAQYPGIRTQATLHKEAGAIRFLSCRSVNFKFPITCRPANKMANPSTQPIIATTRRITLSGKLGGRSLPVPGGRVERRAKLPSILRGSVSRGRRR